MKGRLQLETVSSLALKDNPLGDPRRREVPVYLPPSYGAVRGKRWGVIYLLHGFSGSARKAANVDPWQENVFERFDRLIAEGKAPEALLVAADGFTAYGGSQFLNSSATGRYEDHVALELPAFVEDKFAVRREAAGRAVLGKSSGGFGALTLAMRRPDVFAHAGSHSGDCGFELCYLGDVPKAVAALARHGGSPAAFLKAFRAARDKKGFDHAAVNLLAMASCYSPNPRSPLGFDLPFDPESGALAPKIWERWLALDPVRAAARHAPALRRLRTLWFDAGIRDEFHLHLGARRLSAALKALKVRHRHEEHGLGHFDMASRWDVSLPLFAKAVSRG